MEFTDPTHRTSYCVVETLAFLSVAAREAKNFDAHKKRVFESMVACAIRATKYDLQWWHKAAAILVGEDVDLYVAEQQKPSMLLRQKWRVQFKNRPMDLARIIEKEARERDFRSLRQGFQVEIF